MNKFHGKDAFLKRQQDGAGMIQIPGNGIKNLWGPFHMSFQMGSEGGERGMNPKFSGKVAGDTDVVDCEANVACWKMCCLGDGCDGGVQVLGGKFITHVVELVEPGKFLTGFGFLVAFYLTESDARTRGQVVQYMHHLHFNINLRFKKVPR